MNQHEEVSNGRKMGAEIFSLVGNIPSVARTRQGYLRVSELLMTMSFMCEPRSFVDSERAANCAKN